MRFPVPFEDFRIDASMARNFAETAWGRGGTSTLRTTRNGVYFFSCSVHGGYVVDGRALTPTELALVTRYRKPSLRILVGEHAGKKWVLGFSNPYSTMQKRIRYPIYYANVRWEDYPLLYFEEDCDWAILEHLTNIRAINPKTKMPMTDMQAIESSFHRCFK